MSSKINIGDTFGDWVVIDNPYFKVVGKTKPNRREFVMCRCSCGVEKEVRVEDMRKGKSTKCKDCNQTGKKYTNEYIIQNNDTSILRVVNSKTSEELDFIIDTKYVEDVKKVYWGVIKTKGNNIYLRSSKSRSDKNLVRLHRYIYFLEYGIELKDGDVIDHKNRNTFDNRISNLNLVTYLENAQNASTRRDNTSGVKGVSWNKKKKRWVAYIQYNKKKKVLGAFSTLDEAKKKRIDAEEKYHKYNESLKRSI